MLLIVHSYSEAIDYLYSENAFSFRSPEPFYLFATSILPRRLNLIKSIYLCFVVLEEDTIIPALGKPVSWESVWKELSEMKGLEVLRTELNNQVFIHDIWAKKTALAYRMKVVKQTRVFEVKTSWARVSDLVGDRRFTLEKPEPYRYIVSTAESDLGWSGVDKSEYLS